MSSMVATQVMAIVMEASSKEDKAYMRTMDKHDVHQINGQSIQNLYELTISRSDIDFGEIPKSAGDVEKCKYYENTRQCLDIIKELYDKNNIKDETLYIVKQAMSNMLRFRPQFVAGFRMKHEYVMLMYNSLVLAIVDATTLLIRSYINYIMSADQDYRVINGSDKGRGLVTIETLRMFNQAVDNGTLAQSLKYMNDSKVKNFAGEDVVITGVIIMGLASIVPMMRELIYFYYHSRVKIADYLKMQSDFLEMNKLAVQASSKPPQERKQIAIKQDKVIKELRRLSDKIMINNVDTNDVVKKQVKDESPIFSLPSISQQLSKNKLEGNDLRIL